MLMRSFPSRVRFPTRRRASTRRSSRISCGQTPPTMTVCLVCHCVSINVVVFTFKWKHLKGKSCLGVSRCSLPPPLNTTPSFLSHYVCIPPDISSLTPYVGVHASAERGEEMTQYGPDRVETFLKENGNISWAARVRVGLLSLVKRCRVGYIIFVPRGVRRAIQIRGENAW